MTKSLSNQGEVDPDGVKVLNDLRRRKVTEIEYIGACENAGNYIDRLHARIQKSERDLRAATAEALANDAKFQGATGACAHFIAERDKALQRADFQRRVAPWMDACFGPEISNDQTERNHRFIEEALELAQACGCTQGEAHQLVDYVYGRPTGEKMQEAGGVMVTLAALCLAHRIDMREAGEIELRRIWTKVDEIRAKQAAKPRHSPLPQ